MPQRLLLSIPLALAGLLAAAAPASAHPVGSPTAPAGASDGNAGFLESVDLGVEHIVEGPDHMLFLVMLLLIAPCVAVGGRWVPSLSARDSTIRVAGIVTAFAVGHSLTLALATIGAFSLPTQPVEILIALSVAVTALNAIRPILPGREMSIAAGFGLVHGVAFATLVSDLGLADASVSSIVGFNAGIELAQLAIVALTIPSLYVLSLTRFYPVVRVGAGMLGLATALGWVAERSFDGVTNPLEPVMVALTENGVLIAVALAVLAIAATAVDGARRGALLARLR